ncbi:hypothetical protein ABFV99_02305 [Cytobacillus horneckiae]|uniref:hypothetical protein n=1 Tax=Cytobacillus horneckiae TaxID=549687 RepID=UPI0034CEFFB3
MPLKNGSYYSREDFIRHVSIITLGKYAFNGSPVSFAEVAAYLNVSTNALRLRKLDENVMKPLEHAGIKVKLINGKNHFYLDTEEDNIQVIVNE